MIPFERNLSVLWVFLSAARRIPLFSVTFFRFLCLVLCVSLAFKKRYSRNDYLGWLTEPGSPDRLTSYNSRICTSLFWLPKQLPCGLLYDNFQRFSRSWFNQKNFSASTCRNCSNYHEPSTYLFLSNQINLLVPLSSLFLLMHRKTRTPSTSTFCEYINKQALSPLIFLITVSKTLTLSALTFSAGLTNKKSLYCLREPFNEYFRSLFLHFCYPFFIAKMNFLCHCHHQSPWMSSRSFAMFATFNLPEEYQRTTHI